MKQKIIIILALIFAFCVLGIFINNTYASNFELKITSDLEKVNPGDELKVKLEITNLQTVNSQGVNMFLTTLNYDKTIFEEVQEENIKLLNNWSGLTYNKEKGKILINKFDKITTNEDIMEVTFKVKSETKQKNTIIKIEESSYANGQEELKGNNLNLDINIDDGKKTKLQIILIVSSISITFFTFLIVFLIFRIKKTNEEKYEE